MYSKIQSKLNGINFILNGKITFKFSKNLMKYFLFVLNLKLGGLITYLDDAAVVASSILVLASSDSKKYV